ncbi:flavin monoamine oxidase family protein [Pararobbsia silviterrae]|uniref:FAD-dependent oxidoreductase n=1 Tax=Pararobbsia silviterrae TaxID=1792498 RepID=A0A494XSU8_9BURK|nr:NAD(P)/FAD-dependent oxidoreductase [Pararobbsia silviterrae]RKP53710.1 FAD-dependent oxidoreductase [Pararobbsia silviterrae]
MSAASSTQDVARDPDPASRTARHARPRVAIVGAGLAGLSAAWSLEQAGIEAVVYEASSRVGGRVESLVDRLGTGLVTELGGEFIDSTHADLLGLVEAFDLPLIDTEATSELTLTPSYYFAGAHYSEAQVASEFAGLAARMRIDVDTLSPVISAFRHAPADVRLDRMSIADYLDHAGASGWLRRLLEVAYTTEYGSELGEQSCLNMLSMLSLDASDGDEAFSVFGGSDERFKVRGGNERIVRELAARLHDRIELACRLVSVREHGAGYRLNFDREHGGKEIDADFVVLAIPFTVLREVELPLSLPPSKRLAIDTLGYGSGEKLVVGLSAPVWRDQGRDGGAYSDLAFQTGWDSGRMQATGSAYAFFLGGATGARLTASDPAALAGRYLREADAMFPGIEAAYTGLSVATQWRANPFSRGSYSNFKPGQWTTLAGWEGAPVGNLLFAGEHCSLEFQGFMNGAVESGRRAAETIVARVG